MDESQQKTVAIKSCVACASGLLEHDRFCRWCGVQQPGIATLCEPAAYKTATLTATLSTGLTSGARAETYHRVSGPLVEAVLTGALAGRSINNQSPVLKRMIPALIGIPIWLIIVLLSPLDAYAAVRNLARQA
jgi:hypothetical protein